MPTPFLKGNAVLSSAYRSNPVTCRLFWYYIHTGHFAKTS